jgi:hypothetical protein
MNRIDWFAASDQMTTLQRQNPILATVFAYGVFNVDNLPPWRLGGRVSLDKS